jgi:ADP-heptose:LPS heptosyltransferase
MQIRQGAAGAGRAAHRVPRRRVLIVLGTKGIGDAAEALSVFELIHRSWPAAEVAAGVFKPAQEAVISRSPYVSRVVRLPGHPRENGEALRALVPTVAALRGFDEVLVLDRAERTAWPLILAARLAGARLHHRHGYRYRDRRMSAFATFPAHVFFQLVTAMLLLRQPLAEVVRPHLQPAEEDRRYAEELFARRSWNARRVVLLNTRGPQYGVFMGRWGIERYVAMANLLVANGVIAVVNGGSAAQVREFRGAAHLADPRVELLERPDVAQLCAVMERCDIVVGEPSGPLCLAMAVGTPTVTIQGPGERDYPGHNRSGPVWWPYDAQDLSVSRVAWCERTNGSACLCCRDTKSRTKQRLERVHLWHPYKIVLKRLGLFDRLHPSRWTDRTFRCLDALTPEEVAQAVLTHLETTADRTPRTQGRPRVGPRPHAG